MEAYIPMAPPPPNLEDMWSDGWDRLGDWYSIPKRLGKALGELRH